MDLEEQTLHYYLKVFSITLIILLLFFSLYIFYIFNKKIILSKDHVNIKKGETLENILTKNLYNISIIEIKFIKLYYSIHLFINNSFIHYGDFIINSDSTIIDLIKTISEPSNLYNKITIVEGWSQTQLDEELSKFFNNFQSIPYSEIIADTYFIQRNSNFSTFMNKLKIIKKNYFNDYKNNKLFEEYNKNEIMIIGSLLEKEGLDAIDKKKISSVIFNRLNKNMKLQIDATVLFSITNGNYDLNRKLLLSDLKIDHPFNTYLYTGLPPKPISYVGKKTLDLIFENHKSDFLFYFFNKSLNKHIFSKTYKKHKDKLNEYRKE